ncbi:MAG: hypothetical protein O3C20_23235, partial [Verrucomicrobia bacterium]|nr:hypothetical protein [Verrucomicrobiota bacterium]
TIRSRFMDQEVRGGKYFPVELGVNVPLLVQWTGQIKAGSICNELVDLTDFFPTFCDLANVPLPSGYPLDGRSILPLTQGTNRISKAFTFTWGNYENNSSKYKDPSHNTDKLLDVIRGPRYKFYSDGRLFDIRNDFLEEHPIGPGTSKESDKARIDLKASLEKLRTTQPRTW